MSTIDDQADREPGIPPPEACARKATLRGTAVRMGDGRFWSLADYVPVLAPCFDQLFDDNVLKGKYRPHDIRIAASHLLRENYDLRPPAIAALIAGADDNDLVDAIESAMFGPAMRHAKWSDWVVASLYSVGIDPASVPRERLRDVMDILVEAGRIPPASKFVSSAEAAPRLRMIRERAVEKARSAGGDGAPNPPVAT